MAGRAGEPFAVRNSGALAVVEDLYRARPGYFEQLDALEEALA